MEWLMIGAGGFAGAVARSMLARLVTLWAGEWSFPLGTLSVNVLGSFAFGLLAAWFTGRVAVSPEMRGLVFAGFLGAFTTFSTFSIELLDLLRGGQHLTGGVYLGASVVLSLGAAWLGLTLGQAIQ